MGNDLFPLVLLVIVHFRCQQTKVFCLIVAEDVKPVAQMVDRIFVICLPRREYFEFAVGIVG